MYAVVILSIEHQVFESVKPDTTGFVFLLMKNLQEVRTCRLYVVILFCRREGQKVVIWWFNFVNMHCCQLCCCSDFSDKANGEGTFIPNASETHSVMYCHMPYRVHLSSVKSQTPLYED